MTATTNNGQFDWMCGSNSVVESQPSKLLVAGSIPVSRSRSLVAWCAVEGDVAQLVEHSLGKGEVIGSIPIISSMSLSQARPANAGRMDSRSSEYFDGTVGTANTVSAGCSSHREAG